MNLTKQEAELIADLRKSPNLMDCVKEIVGIAGDKVSFQVADDAEDAVVEAIQKAGANTLQEWTQKQELKAREEAAKDPNLRPHKKGT